MPSAVGTEEINSNIRGGNSKARTQCLKPLVNSGSLNKYTSRDLTPIIGREFEGLQARDLIVADEQLIKDLAATSKLQSQTATNFY
jgi:hypothetical protein